MKTHTKIIQAIKGLPRHDIYFRMFDRSVERKPAILEEDLMSVLVDAIRDDTPAPSPSWRHLDTEKPGDGEKVILYFGEDSFITGKYNAAKNCFFTKHNHRCDLSYWMPALPNPEEKERTI